MVEWIGAEVRASWTEFEPLVSSVDTTIKVELYVPLSTSSCGDTASCFSFPRGHRRIGCYHSESGNRVLNSIVVPLYSRGTPFTLVAICFVPCSSSIRVLYVLSISFNTADSWSFVLSRISRMRLLHTAICVSTQTWFCGHVVWAVIGSFCRVDLAGKMPAFSLQDRQA